MAKFWRCTRSKLGPVFQLALLHLFYSIHNLILLGTLLCYNVEFNCSCSFTLCYALGRGNEVEWSILLMSRHSGKVLVDAHSRFIYWFISFWGSSGKFIDHQYSVYRVKQGHCDLVLKSHGCTGRGHGIVMRNHCCAIPWLSWSC